MEHAKKTVPWVPVGHPDYKWAQGADVQATWRKYGWTPPSEQPATPPSEQPATPVLRKPAQLVLVQVHIRQDRGFV
jgi:hypothetical protein